MATLTLYIVSDGKAGHLAQSRGLAHAIKRLTRARITEVQAEGKRVAPQPEKDAGLILAAGRGTHSMALSLRKYLGVPAVVLMDPGWLGRQRFDLAIIPKHDGIKPSKSVVVTEGALNGMETTVDASPDQGLLLIGGPSKHYSWDADAIEKQVAAILEKDTSILWTATDSRRTPEATSVGLKEGAERSGGRLVYTPATQTPDGWVAEQLRRCGVCWVTEDSVSMVYEALTSGARVGLLPVPRGGSTSRVTRGVESLVQRGWVTAYDDWVNGKALPEDRPALNEADRVARLVLERFGLTDHEV
ncbi:MAG: mitochondrial fission ELM1 family protein [Phycisphaeraceae bacterium]|nr:mitochondrial fission ELM1 family protein [Phycisphaeraceae bacterium]